jgi:hypothetical protein
MREDGARPSDKECLPTPQILVTNYLIASDRTSQPSPPRLLPRCPAHIIKIVYSGLNVSCRCVRGMLKRCVACSFRRTSLQHCSWAAAAHQRSLQCSEIRKRCICTNRPLSQDDTGERRISGTLVNEEIIPAISSFVLLSPFSQGLYCVFLGFVSNLVKILAVFVLHFVEMRLIQTPNNEQIYFSSLFDGMIVSLHQFVIHFVFDI